MITAHGSPELRAVALAMKLVARDVRNDVSRATRQTMNPVWRGAVESRARTPMDRRVLTKGARIAAGNPPSFVAASSSRALSGGFIPTVSWAAYEFGANQNRVTTYSRRSPKGSQHTVRRHTTHQLPSYTPKGRVAYRAVAEVAPRMVSLWVQIVVRAIYEASEKGGR